ncbi:cell death abnormality protein 1-like isoform X2 [Ruditapes philippinarum]|uniref:cell death abnormality protein 1-like isoform X2 n=1 Tax=Ruditapes philippinarum TaxID=129788 RepID=UPI00295A839B|nr:cell death abnormality protein 1-like isoform X2 [Ruditapes philippinarum]
MFWFRHSNMTLGKALLVGALSLFIYVFYCEAKVFGTTCTSSNEKTVCTLENMVCESGACACKAGYNGDETCSKIIGGNCKTSNTCPGDANAVCQSGKCACKAGHEEKESVCTKIIGVNCKTGNTCPGDANAECKNGKCACKAGHMEKDSVCTKVIGGNCNAGSTCPGDANAVCTSGKCVCKLGYEEKDSVCTKTVAGVSCSSDKTACGSIENAACDTNTNKCKCNPDYTMHFVKCEPKNSATMMEICTISLMLSVLTTCLIVLI